MELTLQQIYQITTSTIAFICSIFLVRKYLREEKSISPTSKLTNDLKTLEEKVKPMSAKVETLESQIVLLEERADFLTGKLKDDFDKLNLHDKEIATLQLSQADMMQSVKDSNKIVFKCLMSLMENEINNPSNQADKSKLIQTYDSFKDHIIDQ